MHFQSPIPNWPEVFNYVPNAVFFKAFDASMLVEAKQRWTALGYDPKKLFTDFRYYDYFYPGEQPRSYQEYKDIWKANFLKFVDKTYLERYAPYVDMVEELNEYYDTRMVTDKELLKPLLMSAQAAVEVWNTQFRGRTVIAGGGEGIIPMDCRLVIGNSPVGNDVPREFYQLAVDTDSYLGVHPYTKYTNKIRDSQDFRYHSGRWNWNEQEYGIKPVYAFTECGPYYDSGSGWRAPICQGGNEALLVESMRLWVKDVQTTAAYKEGRILGPGAWFTSGVMGWEDYQLQTGNLVAIMKMMKDNWKQEEKVTVIVDPVKRARALAILEELESLVSGVVKHTLSTYTNQQVINLFNTVFGSLNELQATGLLTPLAAARQALYVGPAIEDMTGINDTQKARLIAVVNRG